MHERVAQPLDRLGQCRLGDDEAEGGDKEERDHGGGGERDNDVATVPLQSLAPIAMDAYLEGFTGKDQNPDSNDAEQAGLERVVFLVAILKQLDH